MGFGIPRVGFGIPRAGSGPRHLLLAPFGGTQLPPNLAPRLALRARGQRERWVGGGTQTPSTPSPHHHGLCTHRCVSFTPTPRERDSESTTRGKEPPRTLSPLHHLPAGPGSPMGSPVASLPSCFRGAGTLRSPGHLPGDSRGDQNLATRAQPWCAGACARTAQGHLRRHREGRRGWGRRHRPAGRLREG